MYSYDDRIRAVKLYIKLDKRIAATIIQLGYPTKNALKTWYQEYEQRQDVSMGYARSRLKYSAKQKQFAVNHYLVGILVHRDRRFWSIVTGHSD